jgi:hypothetical protein
MRRPTLTGLATSLLGLALLVWLVRQVGLAAIADGARQVGFGFLALVALGGVRFFCRALAWRRCLDDPSRLAVSTAFAATLAGDALGNVTPLSVLVSEPAKAAFVRSAVPLGPALSALAVENFLYSLSAAGVVALGLAALLAGVTLPEPLRTTLGLALGLIVGGLAAAGWTLGRRLAVASAALRFLLGPRAAQTRWLARLESLEAKTFALYARRRSRLPAVWLLEVAFHAAGVAEIYLTLWLLAGRPPSLLAAFALESANRVITIVFKVVPLRLGVDEAGTALVTRALGLGTATGVTLALVRKARVLVWVVCGLLLLVRRGLSVRRVLQDRELEQAAGGALAP